MNMISIASFSAALMSSSASSQNVAFCSMNSPQDELERVVFDFQKKIVYFVDTSHEFDIIHQSGFVGVIDPFPVMLPSSGVDIGESGNFDIQGYSFKIRIIEKGSIYYRGESTRIDTMSRDNGVSYLEYIFSPRHGIVSISFVSIHNGVEFAETMISCGKHKFSAETIENSKEK